MGVIRNLNTLINPEQETIEEILENLNNPSALEEEEEEVLQQQQQQIRRERVRRIRHRNPVRPESTNVLHAGRKVKGAKKSRRFENVNFLLSMADGEENSEVTIYDFIPESVSAFAQILMQRESMKLWNDFINRSDEEQEQYLESLDNRLKSSHDRYPSETKDEDDNDNSKHKQHPAFSSELCFKNIDSSLRYMLRHQHVPLGTLAHLEEELAEFFFTKPHSVYRSCLPTSFERLMLHACSQYMSLICKSYNKGGKRWSKVSNHNQTFHRPEMPLAEYLELKRHTSQEKC